MFTTQFGIEIEMTGVTRAKAAKAIGDYLVVQVATEEEARLGTTS